MGIEPKPFEKLFPHNKIPDILTSLLKAGESIKRKSSNEIENRVTRRFYRKVIRLFPFRDGPLNIVLQPEIVEDDDNDDTPSGQIDLMVTCGMGADVYFAIEAKRLRVRLPSGKKHAGSDAYVNDGMMRFVSGQYSPYMHSGAMLGYVYDGKIKEACDGIAQYIVKKADMLLLMPPKKIIASSIVTGKPISETRHDLQNRKFTIYHLLISV